MSSSNRIAAIATCLASLLACACSSKSPATGAGRVVVAFTIDWEGAYISRDGLDTIAALRAQLPAKAPVTHFISAAYLAKTPQDKQAFLTAAAEAVLPADELAVHVHAWKSLAIAAGLTPKLGPSFLTGTDTLLEFEDGDVGFDVDLDAYDVTELHAWLRTSRTLLEQTKHPVSRSFRAGGYMATQKVRQALHDEGYLVDSSATDYRQIADERTDVLPKRIATVWPDVTTASQPWVLGVGGGKLIEMPIAAFTDYAKTDELVQIFDAAHARLGAAPARDVFVVIGVHQESAHDTAAHLADALPKLVAGDRAKRVVFMTVEAAAARAREVTK